MRLDQVLEKIGASIVKQDKTSTGYTLLLRVKTEEPFVTRWKEAISEFLCAQAEQKETEWNTDVSRVYFVPPKTQTVRYLWRIVLGGDVREAAEALGRAAVRTLSAGVEVTSFPLVGRRTYEWDPANGKIMGAHDPKKAALGRASALGGGG